MDAVTDSAIMARFRQKPLFTLEEAREAILDSDSENEFDRMELTSDEEYSDIEEDPRHEELRRLYEEDDFDDPVPVEMEPETDTAPSATATGLERGPAGTGDREVSVTAAGSCSAKRRRVAVSAAAADRSWDDDPKEQPQDFEFTGTPGVSTESGLTDQSTPLDCYLKFVSHETFNDVAEETNRYAASYLEQHPPSPSSPSRKWTRTSGGLYDIFLMICHPCYCYC